MFNLIKRFVVWLDLRQLFKFGWWRVGVLIVTNAIAIFFVDLLHIKYWIFTIFFTPFGFLLNYLVDRHVFKWRREQ